MELDLNLIVISISKFQVDRKMELTLDCLEREMKINGKRNY